MITVIDTSAAVEIVLYREKAELFKALLTKSDIVLAPDLYISEVTNVFWKYQAVMGLSVDKCTKAIQICLEMVDDFILTKDLWQEVFSQSVKSAHSAYDIFYIVTARRNGAQLLTCDKKLHKLAEQLQIQSVME